MSSVLFVGFCFIFLSFFMSVGRLLNVLVVVESVSFLVVLLAAVLGNGVVYLGLLVVFTLESALSLVVLFRVWDTSGLTDVVGR